MNQYLNYLYYIVISVVLIYAYYKLKKYIIEYRLKKREPPNDTKDID